MSNIFHLNANQKLSVIELSTLVFSYYILIWVLFPRALNSTPIHIVILFWLAVIVLYTFYFSPIFIHKDTLVSRGLGPKEHLYFRIDNFIDFFKRVSNIFLLSFLLIVLFAWWKDSPFFTEFNWYAFVLKFTFYLFSALLQELLFFSFVFLRIEELVTSNSRYLHRFITVAIFSFIFMLFHLPNIPLMILSYFFAFVMGYYFYTYRNIYVIIPIHAILGTSLYIIYQLPMKIGSCYKIGKGCHFMRNLIPQINDLIGSLW